MSSYRGKHRRPSKTSQRTASVSVTLMAAASLGNAAATAAPAAPGSPQAFMEQQRENFNNGVLNARDGIVRDTSNLPSTVREPIRQGVDNAVNALAPGALQAREAAREAARKPVPKPAPRPAPQPQPKPANPCPASARACVDLEKDITWLQSNGTITYGPVPMSHGRPGPQTETPKGSFVVTRQVKDEISYEFNNAPMPFATYFTNYGHAFHQGTRSTQSAGCVRMDRADAEYYFYNLKPGDSVFIW